jgi:hypothetical protein
VLAARTRMLYRGGRFFINGEMLDLPAEGRRARAGAVPLLEMLADRRGLDAVQCARAMRLRVLQDTLAAWLAAGWIEARREPPLAPGLTSRADPARPPGRRRSTGSAFRG